MPKGRKKARQLKQGESKLWLLLIGVGEYEDNSLKSLPYAIADCQILGKTLQETTKLFPKTELISLYSQGNFVPKLEIVIQELSRIIQLAESQDTILFYFSGHGVLEPTNQQVYLCVEDTLVTEEKLNHTGLSVVAILDKLADCKAEQKVIILDACHSGGVNLSESDFSAISSNTNNQKKQPSSAVNISSQLIDIFQRRSAYSKGFYSLLSCDVDQRSWEFPELGHGVFSYYLIKGLQGYAADGEGVIEVNSLYKYVYHSTLQYIDKLNQQRRLINQQKTRRGDDNLEQENPLQTPKLIVEAIGELVLGLKETVTQDISFRKALVVEGYSQGKISRDISKFLGTVGGFDLQYWHPQGRYLPDLKLAIQSCLQSNNHNSLANNTLENNVALLYLRGKIQESITGESLLNLDRGISISRSWLRQQIKNSQANQQIIILDCSATESIQSWLDEFNLDNSELKSQPVAGQCLIAGISSLEQPELFARTLLNTLTKDTDSIGFPVANWITKIQQQLPTNIWRNFYLSGVRGIIEVVPSQGASRTAKNVDFGICPYRGLQAFRERDGAYFFGRESLTQSLINAVNHHSFIPVVGASGSGKSSVVRAGLMAELRQGNYIPESDNWWLKVLRPGNNPLQNLALTLVAENDLNIVNEFTADSSENSSNVTQTELQKKQLEIEGLLHLGGEGFVRWIRQRKESTIVLAIDQFEELFTLASEKERRNFIDLLLEALEYASDKFKLIITLRADFIDRCLAIPKLNKLLQQFSILVPPQFNDLNDYRDAIIKPAEAVSLQVETELVEVLLEELENAAGNLPLLQFVLEQLWEYRDKERGTLTLQSYQQQIGGIKTALEQKAEATYQNLDAESQEVARWIFLQLTQVGEGIEDTRRRVSKQSLLTDKYSPSLVENVLNELTTAKLIVINQDRDRATEKSRQNKDLDREIATLNIETTVEVAHEILIRHWSTLQWWLNENRSRLQKQRQIEQWAKQWQSKQKHADFLLQGIKLLEAELTYKQYANDLNTLEINYIKASQKARNIRRFKTISLGTIIIAAIAFIGGFAWRKQQQAQRLELIRLATSDAITIENNQIIADILPDYLKITKQNQKQGKTTAALADYRQIIAISQKLKNAISASLRRGAIELDKNSYNLLSSKKKKIETILETATTSLASIISQEKLPQLAKELENKNYGKLVTPDYSLQENQYTGALKITHSIILGENGAHSDRNNDGYLTEGEEKLIPCKTVADIAKMWREATQNRCDWYGESNIYEAKDCHELGGLTLTQKIFAPHTIFLVERDWQQRCQLLD